MIELTLLTKTDCAWCSDGKKLLDELSREFPLQVGEVDLTSEAGRRLANDHLLMFAPGLIAEGRLIAHGRLSKRALRKELFRLDSLNGSQS